MRLRHPFDKLRAGPARLRRKAFTTLELLVVIGIILLLMAISVLGFRHFDRLASAKQTRAQLNICKNLLIEYERVSGFKYIEEGGLPVNNTTPPPTQYPIYLDPVNARAMLQANQLVAGPSADVGSHTSSASARYSSRAVQNTRYVMTVLARVPGNRNTITNVPTNRILEPTPGMAQAPTLDQAMILDGWGNPIIFVPAGGMVVEVKDPTNTSQTIQFVVRSSGTFPLSQLPQHPTTAMDRPFFASAGQDGRFTSNPGQNDGGGEDNVYSFQQD